MRAPFKTTNKVAFPFGSGVGLLANVFGWVTSLRVNAENLLVNGLQRYGMAHSLISTWQGRDRTNGVGYLRCRNTQRHSDRLRNIFFWSQYGYRLRKKHVIYNSLAR
jgi:hypothetical protein